MVGMFLETQVVGHAQQSVGRIQAQMMVGQKLACQRMVDQKQGQYLAGQTLGQRLVCRMTQ